MKILELKKVCKHYDAFDLKDVSFDLPQGTVTGLVGENGAGKSTIIKSIIDAVHPNSGEIFFKGKNIKALSKTERQKIGIVLDDTGLPLELNIKTLNKVLSKIYSTWDTNKFKCYVKKFGLPEQQLIKTFSKGMKMQLALAVAFSYDNEILILDEPTSGLDPVVRDDIISMLYDYIQDGDKSVLISSHITSDLEKLCDYIVYLHKGEVVMDEEKDEILQKYAVYGIEKKLLTELDKKAVVKIMHRDYGVDVLAIKNLMPESFEYRPVKLEDIMLFYSKGEDLC